MDLFFAPLFSGSSGNSVYVGTPKCKVIVDAGVSGTRITGALHELGVDPASLSGILVTHEHNDHISGVGVLSRKYDLPVYATESTWNAMEGKVGNIPLRNQRIFEAGTGFTIGDLDITGFSIPHDAADPVGFTFEAGACKFSVATDIGAVREDWLRHVLGSDAVLLESNYDPDMLKAGPYPYDLKKRILSRRGHLSNDDAGSAAARLVSGGTKQIILGHLSKENNFPELALKSTEGILFSEGIDPERDVSLCVARRDRITDLFSIHASLTGI